MPRSPFAAIALACALFGATQARADDMSFSGFANGYQTVNVALSAPNATLSELAYAGGLLATLGSGASFTTYCADLYEPVGFGIPVMIQGPWGAPKIYPDMQGILDNPDAAYAKLKEMGKGLFGANGGGLGAALGPNGAGLGAFLYPQEHG